jgi:S-DNA-T family DNA segregation ATPase FtsK/SpoIIIE
MAKRTTTNRKQAPTKRKPAQRSKRTSPQPVFEPLRPEHQRELFALALITAAAITIVFFLVGPAATGVLGQRWVDFTQRLLGWGALLVPLSLGLLGIAILWQERRTDLKLTSATILGTFLLLGALLSMLELSLAEPRKDIADQLGSGGGIVGYSIVSILESVLGKIPAFVLICALALAGVLLTFDITLRELVIGLRDGFLRFWYTVWEPQPVEEERPPPRPQLTNGRRNRQSAVDAAAADSHAYEPPPGASESADDIVPTPIAARPTRASLFKNDQRTAAAAAKAEAKQRDSKASKASNDATLARLLASPSGSPISTPPAAELAKKAPVEVVQEPLEGFEVPPVHRAWPLPSYDMLESYAEGTITDEERRIKALLIEDTLANFKIESKVVGVNTGPAVTQFELEPAVGVKVSKITSLEKDLMMALAASSIRIEAPIPGKKYVGIEIPNSAISIVGMRDVIDCEDFENYKGKLKIPLGKDVSGTPVIAALERMPHLLVAGSTGTGKSVAINCYVCALLLKFTPAELKFIMIDPKMVEMSIYNSIPHMLSPVVTELERVVPTLKWATREMERRYKVFAKYGFRNIESYKQAARRRADLEPMPYIVVIIDELADLMMMAPDEVETLICRLAQMARATGIHLIIATQRPSVDVVTGLIKANFPSRIAFAVTSQIDSRVILDMNGAEQLLGRGDMLYMAADSAKPIRIQGTWVSENEVEQIVRFWREAKPPEEEAASQTSAQPKPLALTDGDKPSSDDGPKVDTKGLGEFLNSEEQDELLPQAIKLVKQHQRASASLLQRRLRIGYSKAAQLIDLLEQQGVVGPAEDGRSREVLK